MDSNFEPIYSNLRTPKDLWGFLRGTNQRILLRVGFITEIQSKEGDACGSEALEQFVKKHRITRKSIPLDVRI